MNQSSDLETELIKMPRFERALLNLPRVLALERYAEEGGFDDAKAASHFLSRVIIALNGLATELNSASSDKSMGARASAEAAHVLWRFGEACALHSSDLEMRDDARPQ